MTNILDQEIPRPPLNALDELMNRDPLDLSAQHIDDIIAYQRKQRAAREAGVRTKGKRGAAATTGVTIDLAALGLVAKAPTVSPANKVTRRF